MGKEVFDEDSFEKTGRAKSSFKPILIFLVVVVLLAVLYFAYSFFFVSYQEIPKCTDGTFYNSCSLDKPYFCQEGRFVEDTSCGCSDNFLLTNGTCISNYDKGLEERYFNYTLDGQVNQLYFKFRPKVLEELNSLSRSQTYREGENPRRDDFKIKKIDNSLQREFMIPLVVAIENEASDSRDLQAKIAASFVQNIPYSEPNFTSFFGNEIRLARYPYGVLGENAGSCEGKSELLASIYDELGFGVAIFYFSKENHEAVGIKCPVEYSYKKSGYCFVETTVPSPISFSGGKYIGLGGAGYLTSEPEIILITDGLSLSRNLEDYEDADDLADLVYSSDINGGLNVFQKKRMDELREKYGLSY